MRRALLILPLLGLLGLLALLGAAGTGEHAHRPRGEIKIDGSSTVFLISQAMATHFKKLHPEVSISVGLSGSGGGFKKMANGEIDIADASRAVKSGETGRCRQNGIELTELQVGWDGLAIVIHPQNTWARTMTLAQLRKIWHPDSAAQSWSDVDPSWPRAKIALYGADTESGTFDYFTEAVNGKEKRTRTDYAAGADDNTLVKGVSRNKYALGYVGVAYYEGNKDALEVVALYNSQRGAFVRPEPKNVQARTYPLSRPLYIYLRRDALARPEVRQFAEFYMRRSDLVSEARYVPLSSFQQRKEQLKLRRALGAAS